jgi:ABC-type Fe3+-citrate transport system substrate-binding protein
LNNNTYGHYEKSKEYEKQIKEHEKHASNLKKKLNQGENFSPDVSMDNENKFKDYENQLFLLREQ